MIVVENWPAAKEPANDNPVRTRPEPTMIVVEKRPTAKGPPNDNPKTSKGWFLILIEGAHLNSAFQAILNLFRR